MEKFTKGEWVVSHHKDEIAVYMGEAVTSPYEYQCSDVWSCDVYWSENDETAEANAHLIAAAPDMYRALRNVADRATSLVPDKDGIYKSYLTQQEVDAIRAALAKADGEQQQ